jgi:hypothetical protein
MTTHDKLAAILSRAKAMSDEKNRRWSEIDTQVLLIEPVLDLAGWNLLDYKQVRRVSRAKNGQEFDIGLYGPDPDHVKIAIECKSLGNHWCRIPQTLANIGQLTNGGDSTNPRWLHDWKKCDGIGQLRSYCFNYTKTFREAYSIPLLTDGWDWIIFKAAIFCKDPESSITDDAKVAHRNLGDSEFESEIIENIRLIR